MEEDKTDRKTKIAVFLVALAAMSLMLVACGDEKKAEKVENTPTAVVEENSLKSDDKVVEATEQEKQVEKTEQVSEPVVEDKNQQEDSGEETAKNDNEDIIKKIQIASDDVGIYATVLTLSDKIADEGEIEFIYYGPKGAPEEGSIVNTYQAIYFKAESGNYDVTTYYNGSLDTHNTGKSEIKINNTFGATTRAGDVTIYYIPKGGEKTQIFYGVAEDYMPKN